MHNNDTTSINQPVEFIIHKGEFNLQENPA